LEPPPDWAGEPPPNALGAVFRWAEYNKDVSFDEFLQKLDNRDFVEGIRNFGQKRAEILIDYFGKYHLETPRRSTALPIELWEYAESLGGGNYSEGIRKALEYHKNNH
jgi:hypothetical protein